MRVGVSSHNGFHVDDWYEGDGFLLRIGLTDGVPTQFGGQKGITLLAVEINAVRWALGERLRNRINIYYGNNKKFINIWFYNTNSITIVHGLDTLNLNYRVVCSGISRSDLVQSTSFVDGNERNAFTVNLVSNETGFVQVLTSDIILY